MLKTSKLSNWQIQLVKKLIRKKQTLKIIIFKSLGMDYVWVIVKNPSTNVVHEYSKDYINILEKNLDINCDFMVLGEKEIDNDEIPENSIVLTSLPGSFSL